MNQGGEINYKVTVQYIDFPVGVSPAYTVRNSLTEEDAKKLAKEMNQKNESLGTHGSVYCRYEAVKMI